jgi:hypothetical protein
VTRRCRRIFSATRAFPHIDDPDVAVRVDH